MKKHLCADIEEAIENAMELRCCLTDENGKELYTVAMVREYLRGQLAKGRKYLPYGVCDNFDYQTGCKGHKKGG